MPCGRSRRVSTGIGHAPMSAVVGIPRLVQVHRTVPWTPAQCVPGLHWATEDSGPEREYKARQAALGATWTGPGGGWSPIPETQARTGRCFRRAPSYMQGCAGRCRGMRARFIFIVSLTVPDNIVLLKQGKYSYKIKLSFRV